MMNDYEFQQLLDRAMPNKLYVRRIDDHTVASTPRNQEHGVCDFCGVNADHPKLYDAEDVEIALFNVDGKSEVTQSVGAWGACIRCAIMIDAERREALIDRAITIATKRRYEAFPDLDKLSLSTQRDMHRMGNLMLAASHDAFWRAKK